MNTATETRIEEMLAVPDISEDTLLFLIEQLLGEGDSLSHLMDTIVDHPSATTRIWGRVAGEPDVDLATAHHALELLVAQYDIYTLNRIG